LSLGKGYFRELSSFFSTVTYTEGKILKQDKP
jgi:hypothetical protein